MAGAGPIHRFSTRVYYEDTDAAGIVYYANYLKFAERARTEMLRAVGVDHTTLRERTGAVFAVRRCSAEYLQPARLDDLLEIHTRVLDLRGAAIEIEQVVARDRDELARLQLTLVCIGPGGRATRVPKMVIDAITPHLPLPT